MNLVVQSTKEHANNFTLNPNKPGCGIEKAVNFTLPDDTVMFIFVIK